MSAYVIAESLHIDSPDMAEYRRRAQASIALHGGAYLVRGALPDPLEGQWAEGNRMVIIEFPSMARAKAWYSSPEYAQARAARSEPYERRMLFVDGL
ncbi:DUF1330 domain-containing protein [Streptomyces anulatus]|uniref:DUF1330 domain-containing protein n=1 Tax=Streptomyces anulatus TaxID=1892 RepID=UPI0036FA4861